MSSEVLRAFKENIEYVLQLKQLNMELLETLQLTMLWFKDYHEKTGLPVPNAEAFASLMIKADHLIDEICSSTPTLQHRFRTPKDATESATNTQKD